MDLTKEQEKKFKKLRWSSALRGLKLSLATGLMLFVASAVVTAIGVLAVQSKAFIALGALLNGLFIGSYLLRGLQKERDRIKEEVKKILETA